MDIEQAVSKSGWVPQMASQLGEIPGYEIQNLIGHGGMGAVYAAKQLSDNRLVAIKIARPKVLGGKTYMAQIAHEAFVMAKLNHKNIVKVYDAGCYKNRMWMAMEFIKGATLQQFLKRWPITLHFTLAISKQLCQALQHAHKHGVFHQDLKLGNILIDTNHQAKIIDFGLSRVLNSSYTIARPGVTMGTPNYMAPEQLLHPRDCDHRIDIYALGVIIYQLITGELPEVDTQQKKFWPLSRYVNVSERTDHIILRCLEPNPSDRWQSVDALLSELSKLTEDDLNTLKSCSYLIPTPSVKKKVKSIEDDHNTTMRILR